MEVENVGERSNDAVENTNVVDTTSIAATVEPNQPNKKSNKKFLIIGIIIAAVVIIGLTVAIVIVVINNNNNNNNGNQSQNVEAGLTDEEAEAIYDEGINEVMKGFALEEGPSLEDIITAIKEKMDTATDEKVKARYAVDYYQYLPVLDVNRERKDEILSGVIAADDIVQSPSSAAAVMSVAQIYGDQDMYDRYSVLLQDRATEKDKELMEEYEKGEYEESGNEEEGGVGVYGEAKLA